MSPLIFPYGSSEHFSYSELSMLAMKRGKEDQLFGFFELCGVFYVNLRQSVLEVGVGSKSFFITVHQYESVCRVETLSCGYSFRAHNLETN